MRDQSILVADFTMQHYAAAYRLWRACEGIGVSEADSEAGMKAYLSRNPGMSVVALRDADLVGTLLAGHDGRRGYLHHLAVHPDYRCRGIARKLLDRALVNLAREGITKCHGFVFRSNIEALQFWQRAGYEIRENLLVVSTPAGLLQPPFTSG